MLRKYRRLAVGLALTAVVVFLCLVVPGVLLDAGSRFDVGILQRYPQLFHMGALGDAAHIDGH